VITELVTKYYSGDQIKNNEIERACSMCGERRGYAVVWWGNLREEDHLEEPGINGRIILKWIFIKWDGGMDWIDVAQDRDRWQPLINPLMNLRFP
jgi:hypothetical protein